MALGKMLVFNQIDWLSGQKAGQVVGGERTEVCNLEFQSGRHLGQKVRASRVDA